VRQAAARRASVSAAGGAQRAAQNAVRASAPTARRCSRLSNRPMLIGLQKSRDGSVVLPIHTFHASSRDMREARAAQASAEVQWPSASSSDR